jgi:Chalcone isomerase-like
MTNADGHCQLPLTKTSTARPDALLPIMIVSQSTILPEYTELLVVDGMFRVLNRVVGPALALQLPLAVSYVERARRQQGFATLLITQTQYQNQKRVFLPPSDKVFMSLTCFFETMLLSTTGEAASISSLIAKSGASPEEAMLLEQPTSVMDESKDDSPTFEVMSELADGQVASVWKSQPKQTTVQGVTLKPTTALSATKPRTLLRNGYGTRTVRAPFGYNLHVYVVALYTTVPVQSEQNVQELLFHSAVDDGGFVMEFTFLRDITPSQMSIAWNYQLDTSVTAADYEGYDQDRAQFLKLLGEGPMAENGVIRLEVLTGGANPKTLLTNQGELVGEIEGTNFQKAFASMWFGDQPVMEEIKSGLLQGDSIVEEVVNVQVASKNVVAHEQGATEPVALQAENFAACDLIPSSQV